MRSSYSHIISTMIFILLQVLFLNNINLFGYINPFLFLVLLIRIPEENPKWSILFYAFLIGIILDIFEGNLGVHSSSLVFIAYLKPYLYQLVIPAKSIDERDYFTLQKVGLKNFSTYSFIIIFAHNSLLFMLKHSYQIDITFVFMKIVLSSIITFIIILIYQLFNYKIKD